MKDRNLSRPPAPRTGVGNYVLVVGFALHMRMRNRNFFQQGIRDGSARQDFAGMPQDGVRSRHCFAHTHLRCRQHEYRQQDPEEDGRFSQVETPEYENYVTRESPAAEEKCDACNQPALCCIPFPWRMGG